MLTYRRHSDIGNGKSIYLRNLQASCFDPEVGLGPERVSLPDAATVNDDHTAAPLSQFASCIQLMMPHTHVMAFIISQVITSIML